MRGLALAIVVAGATTKVPVRRAPGLDINGTPCSAGGRRVAAVGFGGQQANGRSKARWRDATSRVRGMAWRGPRRPAGCRSVCGASSA
jgi:hypothetical protein